MKYKSIANVCVVCVATCATGIALWGTYCSAQPVFQCPVEQGCRAYLQEQTGNACSSTSNYRCTGEFYSPTIKIGDCGAPVFTGYDQYVEVTASVTLYVYECLNPCVEFLCDCNNPQLVSATEVPGRQDYLQNNMCGR